MFGSKKVIGICMTLIFNSQHAKTIDYVKKEAAKYGYYVSIFNSVVDFFNGDSFDEGARHIYENIDLDIVDALVIFSDNFHIKGIVEDIVKRAAGLGKPVIVVDEDIEGSICFLKDYDEAYRDLMNHVIKEHGARDTFYLAGRDDPEEDKQSVHRIDLYKEVLAENGLTFDEGMVDYGGYWVTPTIEAMNRLEKKRAGKMPEAIFCANDYMAIAACDWLAERGYRVPADVMVTGFDGVPDIQYYVPRITSCTEDHERQIRDIFAVLDKALKGETVERIYKTYYRIAVGESCGCEILYEKKLDMSSLFQLCHSMENNEAMMQSWTDKMMECASYNQLSNMLSKFILPKSVILLNKEIIQQISESGYALGHNDFVAIRQQDEAGEEQNKAYAPKEVGRLLVPGDDADRTLIITSLFVADMPCGYYVVEQEGEARMNAHIIHRVARTINIGLNGMLNTMKQKRMTERIENAAVHNPLTGLPNLRGAETWFQYFSSREEVHNEPLIVTVFSLDKYKYIYENYGLADIEEIMEYIAQTLKLINQHMVYVAHISENEFLLVIFGRDREFVTAKLNETKTEFDKAINHFNNNSRKEYYIEINSGSTYIERGWSGNLASFSKMANAEMYMDRVKNGIGKVSKEKENAKDNYDALNVLIEKNMFWYCFQPIINAENGEIYAYEALMRTDASIGMNPLEVLDAAENYKRLYDIEKATMFNVMNYYAMHRERFGKARIFINHIPGYALRDKDYAQLCERYAEFLGNFVFEITEQNTITDAELDMLKHMGGGTSQIAVDDYGTGHSNIVNLLRYAPHIIKIDRFLISEIDRDVNKQMFVKSTIEFARMNNIKILAEGVETSAEMKTVIDFGVDYIQGYYTGKPAPEPIGEIAMEIRQEVCDANPLFANRG